MTHEPTTEEIDRNFPAIVVGGVGNIMAFEGIEGDLDERSIEV